MYSSDEQVSRQVGWYDMPHVYVHLNKPDRHVPVVVLAVASSPLFMYIVTCTPVGLREIWIYYISLHICDYVMLLCVMCVVSVSWTEDVQEPSVAKHS